MGAYSGAGFTTHDDFDWRKKGDYWTVVPLPSWWHCVLLQEAIGGGCSSSFYVCQSKKDNWPISTHDLVPMSSSFFKGNCVFSVYFYTT